MPNPFECLYISDDSDSEYEFEFEPEPAPVSPRAVPKKILDADPFINKLLNMYYDGKF